MMTTSGCCSVMNLRMQNYGDPTKYLHRTEEVQAVTAEQVLTAYRTYFARTPMRAANGKVNPIRWVVVDKDGRFTFGN